MEGSTVGVLALRSFQVIVGAIIIGLSVHVHNTLSKLISECHDYQRVNSDYSCSTDGWYSSSAYFIFVGAWGMLEGVFGLAAAFVGALSWIIVLPVDALALIFFLAGGIREAVLVSDIGYHPSQLNSFITYNKADEAFMWIGFIAAIAAVVLVFLTRSRGGISRSSAV